PVRPHFVHTPRAGTECNNQLFYQEWIVDSNGNSNVIFACQQLIDSVVNQVHPNFSFILMETKTEVAYRKVLRQFKTKFPNARPSSVMIDFETGLYNVFQQTYPEATTLSCWFHFVQDFHNDSNVEVEIPFVQVPENLLALTHKTR
ncbi:MULE domain-containing protein, partial [Aphis craccivora]